MISNIPKAFLILNTFHMTSYFLTAKNKVTSACDNFKLILHNAGYYIPTFFLLRFLTSTTLCSEFKTNSSIWREL